MRSIIVGLGIQGRKRLAVADRDVVATVDPVAPSAHHHTVEEVPLDSFEAALVCTPDQAKPAILHYLLSHGKHVLVEKPLLAADARQLRRLADTARASGAVCYTAYNHRFEPNVVNLKGLLDAGTLGKIYLARFYYGNGTARDVRNSPWRDQGPGVLTDLGSHLLDLSLFLFGPSARRFEPWNCHRFENRAFDHCFFGSRGQPSLELEVSLLSWRNTFTVDLHGELGSAHIHGLCKWGPSTLTVRKWVLPSGRPTEVVQTVEGPDPTWMKEYAYFKELCRQGGTNIDNDLWINAALGDTARAAGEGLAA